jgi:DNA-binding MarR family transcriptional regulator
VNREVQRRAVPEHTPACLQALAAIARTDAKRVSDIADRLRIDLSVASRQVAVLEASDWIRREPDPEDGRAQRLEATEAGLAALAEAHVRITSAHAGVLDGWSDDELRSLHASIARLREDLGRPVERVSAAARSSVAP